MAWDWKAFWDKTSELVGESDRACVLVCAATLEAKTEDLLRLFFLKQSNPHGEEELRAANKAIDFFVSYEGSSNPPLASVSTQTRLLVLLKVLDANTATAIRNVAKTRNRFAHQEHPSPLTTEEIKNIRNLVPQKVKDDMGDILSETSIDDKPRHAPLTVERLNFIAVAILLSVTLERAARKLVMPGGLIQDKPTQPS